MLDILKFMPHRALVVRGEQLDPNTLPKLVECMPNELVVVYFGDSHVFILSGTGEHTADIIMAVDGKLTKVYTPNTDTLRASIPATITDVAERFDFACRAVLSNSVPAIWDYHDPYIHISKLVS